LRDGQVDKTINEKKAKNRKYEYEDDLNSMSPVSALSQSLTNSSTTSLEEATSKARIATNSVKHTPNTQRMVKQAGLESKSREPPPAYNNSRTPTVSKAIKSASSAVRSKDETTRTYQTSSGTYSYDKAEEDKIKLSENAPSLSRLDGRKAKPAVTGNGTSSASRLPRDADHVPNYAFSSSLAAREATKNRLPLSDKEVRSSSSSKNTKPAADLVDRKGKGRLTDLSTSSPEKSRPITLSSTRHINVNEEEEDSFAVAISSTVPKSSTGRYDSSGHPVSSLRLAEECRQPVDRGKPSPVFKTKTGSSRERQPASGSTSRPKALPAVQFQPEAILPMDLTRLESSGRVSRPETPGRSPIKQKVEVLIESSPASKKRLERPSSKVLRDHERKSKRRSVEREVPKVERSDSPAEQTQVLWRKAAFSDSFDFEGNGDIKMHESENDSDGDVPLVDYREAGEERSSTLIVAHCAALYVTLSRSLSSTLSFLRPCPSFPPFKVFRKAA